MFTAYLQSKIKNSKPHWTFLALLCDLDPNRSLWSVHVLFCLYVYALCTVFAGKDNTYIFLFSDEQALFSCHFNWTFARPSSETFTRAGLP